MFLTPAVVIRFVQDTLLLTDGQNNNPKLTSLIIWRLAFIWMLYQNSVPNSQEM